MNEPLNTALINSITYACTELTILSVSTLFNAVEGIGRTFIDSHFFGVVKQTKENVDFLSPSFPYVRYGTW